MGISTQENTIITNGRPFGTSGSTPLVSVLMLAYNVEDYIADAINGVLAQRGDFRIELVIGEDCSSDTTLDICRTFAERYPETITVITGTENLGIAGNAARTLAHCSGQYLAICDSDDIWEDPLKLQQQVQFLEAQPDYGLSYSDVRMISADGREIVDPKHDELRNIYAQGNIFIRLLHGNFIHNSTAVCRRRLLDNHQIDTDRFYYIHDYFMWLHVSLVSKAHYLNARTTAYRKHPGNVTNSEKKARQNSIKFHQALFHYVLEFDRQNTQRLTKWEKTFIFRKLLSLLFRRTDTPGMKQQIAPLLPRYFPGLSGLWNIAWFSPRELLPRLYQDQYIQI